MANDDRHELTGAAGGEAVGADPPFTDGAAAGGLDEVVEQARRTAWGPDERELNEDRG